MADPVLPSGFKVIDAVPSGFKIAPKELSPAGKMLASNPVVGGFMALRSMAPDVADWAATRGIGAGASLVGTPRATGDLTKSIVDWIGEKTGVNPSQLMRGLPLGMQVAPALAPVLPGAAEARSGALTALDQREVNLPGPIGKVVDSAVEAGIGSLPFGPGAIIPSAVGGAGSETAGLLTKGTAWEPWARLAGGLAGGAAGAVGQAALTRPTTTAPASTPDRKAADVFAKSLRRDKITPAEAEAQLAALGPEGMIADVGGRNVRGKVALAANTPGAGQEMLDKALAARKGGEGSRVENLMSSVVGKRAASTVDEIVARRSGEGSPLFKEALEVGPVTNDKIQRFMADPLFQRGAKEGLEMQRLAALREGKPFNPADYGVTGFTAAGDPILGPVPNMRLLHATKRGIDKIVEGYRNPTTGRLDLDPLGVEINATLRSFVDELKALNPKYGEALATWAGPSKMLDAVAWGKAVLNQSADPYTVAKRYSAMNDSEKMAARTGVADWIRQKVGETTRGSQAQRIYGDTNATLNNQAERLKIIFGEDFPKIQKLAENEAAFNRTLKLLSGSRTQPLAEEGADLGGMIRAGVGASYGNPLSVLELANKGVNWAQARAGVGSEAVRDAMAKLATARTAEEKAAALKLISEAYNAQKRGSTFGRAVGTFGTFPFRTP